MGWIILLTKEEIESVFIAATEPYKTNMYANQELITRAIELLEKAREKVVIGSGSTA